jgi:hypothetical protein
LIFSAAIALRSPLLLAATFNVPPDNLPPELVFSDVLNLSTVINNILFSSSSTSSDINLLPGGGFEVGVYTRGSVNAQPGAVGLGSLVLDSGSFIAMGGSFGPTSVLNDGGIRFDGARMLDGVQLINSSIQFISGQLGSPVLGGGTGSSLIIESEGVSGEILANSPSEVSILGGAFTETEGPRINTAGRTTFVVRHALLDGAPIPGLTPRGTVEITSRNVVLEGVLDDGSPLDIVLATADSPTTRHVFSPPARVFVFLTPEPDAVGFAAIALLALMRHRTGQRPALPAEAA